MIISIGNKTKKSMNILELQNYPFTVEEIKKNYRRLINENHPDKGGDVKKAQKINEAYNEIKNLAVSDINQDNIDNSILEMKKKQNNDMFAIYKECKHCFGSGERITKYNRVCCPDCNPDPIWNHHERLIIYALFFTLGRKYTPGLKVVECHQCDSKGMFTLRSGRKITCRNCKGRKYKIVKCRRCKGKGYTGKERTEIIKCVYCKGTGKKEVKPFNPVIPKGAIL